MHAVGKIGVIAPPITHALIVDALDGIDRTARAAGYDVVVFTCSTNPKQPYSKVRDPFYIHHISGEKEIYDLAVRADLDGYIILADYFFDQEFVGELLRQFHQRGARCVVLEKENKLYPYVYAEQQKIVYRITEHLIQVHGCKLLYCLTGQKDRFEAIQRRDGFLEALRDNGLPVSEEQVFYGNFWMNTAQDFANKILNGEVPKPDGVVCANDMMAIALCDALQAGGISVPGDVAVTGYDGTMQALIHDPPVTTVKGCGQQAGRLAVENLLKQLGVQSPCKPLEPTLIGRQLRLSGVPRGCCRCCGTKQYHYPAADADGGVYERQPHCPAVQCGGCAGTAASDQRNCLSGAELDGNRRVRMQRLAGEISTGTVLPAASVYRPDAASDGHPGRRICPCRCQLSGTADPAPLCGASCAHAGAVDPAA